MPRKLDMLNIRPHGKGYQVRVRLVDDRGKLRTFTETFPTLKEAIVYRDDRRAQARLGELGDKLARRKRFQSCTLRDVIFEYERHILFTSKPSFKNEGIILKAFRERAPELCKKSILDLETRDFGDYRAKRIAA